MGRKKNPHSSTHIFPLLHTPFKHVLRSHHALLSYNYVVPLQLLLNHSCVRVHLFLPLFFFFLEEPTNIRVMEENNLIRSTILCPQFKQYAVSKQGKPIKLLFEHSTKYILSNYCSTRPLKCPDLGAATFFFNPADPQAITYREAYQYFQPSLTSSAGGTKGCSDHRFRGPPAYTAKLPTLHQHRANNQCRTANQI